MFLGTTALSEFWDTEQEILFLGSWCLRYDRSDEWEALRYRVLPCPWDDRVRFYKAAEYADQCEERMLARLTDYLNAVHSVSFAKRYWRILIGPWLIHYVHGFYDRYTHLREAFGTCSDLQTIVLDNRSFQIPTDTGHFLELICGDSYNLQLFSQQCLEMGYIFPARRLVSDCRYESGGGSEESHGITTSVARRVLRVAERLAHRFLMGKCDISLCNMSWPRSKIWSLSWRTHFRAAPYTIRGGILPAANGPVFDARRNCLGELPTSDEFERVLVNSLPDNFPVCYLEGYQSARDKALGLVGTMAPVIASDAGWYSSELFKLVAAEASERGTSLLTLQHGGGYGAYRFSALERHERRLGDCFMAWGWADQGSESCTNLPSPVLSSLLSVKGNRSGPHQPKAILYVTTSDPRYCWRFHSSPTGSQWEEYWAWGLRFLGALPDRLRSMVLWRPHPFDYGHAIWQRVSKHFPDLHRDTKGVLVRKLDQYRIVVIDHHATTLLETLTANIPTVLFWDPRRWEVREEAEQYFRELREVGVLWDSPEEAAFKVCEVYDEPWTWWGDECVQGVRRKFVERYAFARANWFDYWDRALRQEAIQTKAARSANPPERSGIICGGQPSRTDDDLFH